MAQLLIKVGDQSSHEVHFKDGDVVCVKDDKHVWGRCENLDVWKSEGLDPKDWPGGFVIVHVPDAQVSEVEHLAIRPESSTDEKGPARGYSIDYKAAPVDLAETGTIVATKVQLSGAVDAKPLAVPVDK